MQASFDSVVPAPWHEAIRLLDRWYMAASAQGTLWIQARMFPVRSDDCCSLFKRLARTAEKGAFQTAILDLGETQIPERRWPVFLRIVSMVAKRMRSGFRIVPSSESDESAVAPSQDAASANQPRPESLCIIFESLAQPQIAERLSA